MEPKNFFSLQTKGLTKSFDGLNTSVAQSTSKLGDYKVLVNMGKLYLLKQHLAGSKGVKTEKSEIKDIFILCQTHGPYHKDTQITQ